jgi:ribonuclease E
MLDDIEYNTDDQHDDAQRGRSGADQPSSQPAEDAAPVKKAARKAPAKRAPRKTTAKKAAAGPVAEGLPATEAAATGDARPELAAPPTITEPPAAQPPAGESATEPAKKATRARKTTAKKTTAKATKAAPPAADQPAVEPVVEQLAVEPAVVPVESTVPDTAGPAAPAKRTRKQPAKRAKKVAEPAAETAADDAAAGDVAAAPALVAPAVIFQPPVEQAPVEAKPTRRRRTSKAAQPAVEPAVPIEDIDTDELADSDPAAAGTAVIGTEDAEADQQGTDESEPGRRRRRRGRRGRGGSRAGETAADSQLSAEGEDGESADEDEADHAEEVAEAALSASARRRRRRRRSSGADGEAAGSEDDPPNTVVHVRDSRAKSGAADDDGVRGVKGSTRLEAKRQRRRDNRDSGRRRAPILTEAEFLARRESVNRVMAVRQTGDRTQIAVLEDDILVEHYVTRASSSSAVGNVYLGRVQNVLPSMEAAFIDIGRGRNGVLYAGEVNWDTAGLEGKARSIENALSPGDTVLVQVTKDPIGHKGARLTSQISLPGRFVVYVPGGGMTGISRKLPDTERSRLKAILKKVVPDEAGVIVRTAAEGASEQDLVSDVERLKTEWESISRKMAKKSADGPILVHGEPDLAIRVVRDIFNDDFGKLIVSGAEIHHTLTEYVADIAPDLADRVSRHTADSDLFADLRVDEQLAKALDRKVWLPSGGSLVIDRTEAMTVIDVNTGKYTGSGGNLEQTVTRNNLEAAEEIVRQLRLRDLGGIVVIDFIDMVLESNRELVLRRLTECLGRDRTKHQVAEVTSLGLVQMTRKRVGEGLLEAFSEPCPHCNGRGLLVHMEPVDRRSGGQSGGGQVEEERPARAKRTRKPKAAAQPDANELAAESDKRRQAASAVAAIAAATAHKAEASSESGPDGLARAATELASQTGAIEPVRSEPHTRAGRSTPAQAEPVPASVNGSQPDQPAPTRPRRRRAASRPAGPPVPVDAG